MVHLLLRVDDVDLARAVPGERLKRKPKRALPDAAEGERDIFVTARDKPPTATR